MKGKTRQGDEAEVCRDRYDSDLPEVDVAGIDDRRYGFSSIHIYGRAQYMESCGVRELIPLLWEWTGFVYSTH